VNATSWNKSDPRTLAEERAALSGAGGRLCLWQEVRSRSIAAVRAGSGCAGCRNRNGPAPRRRQVRPERPQRRVRFCQIEAVDVEPLVTTGIIADFSAPRAVSRRDRGRVGQREYLHAELQGKQREAKFPCGVRHSCRQARSGEYCASNTVLKACVVGEPSLVARFKSLRERLQHSQTQPT
jgi:hypothetical protein